MHSLVVDKSPRVQLQFASTAQVLSQPSLFIEFPSSQYPAVGVTTNPSPHKSEQVLGVEESPRVHSHFDSTAHVLPHPSSVTAFPSSQYPTVGSITFPSPQTSSQTLAIAKLPNVQLQSDSTAQVSSHPSPLRMFPSSQYPEVGEMTFPSPHLSMQTLEVEESPRVHS